MTNCIKVTLEADRGATLNSPNFFSIEEITPPNTDIGEIEDGILNGTYTPVDPNLYTYKGVVRSDYEQAILHTLNISIKTVTIEGTVEGGTNQYDVVVFKIPPTETETWENKAACLIFDIKRTLKADPTEVDVWVKGTIEVNPVVTE